MIRNYRLKFDELPINQNEIQELLGFGDGEMPEPFNSYVKEAFLEANKICDIQGSLFISDAIEFLANNSEFSIEGQVFHAGKLITRQMKNSSLFALFICTAGDKIGQLSQDMLQGDDPVKGYVYDVIGSTTVEAAMEKIQQLLREEFRPLGMNISNRYSPGYCDWHVSEQQKLFSFFPDKHCGISLNASSLMHPIKSVSGVLGIGKDVKFNKHHCDMCNSTSCIYRNKKIRAE